MTLDLIYDLISQGKYTDIKKQKKILWENIKSESLYIWSELYNNSEKMYRYQQIISTYFSDNLSFDLQKIGFLSTLNKIHQENQKNKDRKIGKQKVLINNIEKILYCDDKGNEFDFPIIIDQDLFDMFCTFKNDEVKYTYLISVYKDQSLEQLSNIYYLNAFYKKLGAA